ncbi:MAG: ATP-binding protein [Clostridia bacterium]|nr:ATP-binding protein [Clostridia bacterium]
MAKVILICGKICSGKTFYSNKLKINNNAVILSSDELISDLFHPNENDYHEQIINKVHQYLFKKTIEIVNNGENVILDWGFWTKKNREDVSKLFNSKGVKFEWHYIDVSDEKWQRNIENRNGRVLSGDTNDYYVDDGLLKKVINKFETPEKSEIDCWIEEK